MSDQNPQKASRPAIHGAARKPDLVFREAPHMSSLVFTSLDRAVEVNRLHRAIESSETWGDFRRKIGPDEYARLYEGAFDPPDPDEDPEEIDEDRLEPADDEPFSSDNVPGYSDGDYPPWLATEINRYLPTDILQRFGRRDSSILNGAFYKIEITQREAILKALTDVGFTVEEREDLKFW